MCDVELSSAVAIERVEEGSESTRVTMAFRPTTASQPRRRSKRLNACKVYQDGSLKRACVSSIFATAPPVPVCEC